MGWWRALWQRPRDEAQIEARAAAAAMARLRGQCGVAAGECMPWDAPDRGEDCRREHKDGEGAGDERR